MVPVNGEAVICTKTSSPAHKPIGTEAYCAKAPTPVWGRCPISRNQRRHLGQGEVRLVTFGSSDREVRRDHFHGKEIRARALRGESMSDLQGDIREAFALTVREALGADLGKELSNADYSQEQKGETKADRPGLHQTISVRVALSDRAKYLVAKLVKGFQKIFR